MKTLKNRRVRAENLKTGEVTFYRIGESLKQHNAWHWQLINDDGLCVRNLRQWQYENRSLIEYGIKYTIEG